MVSRLALQLVRVLMIVLWVSLFATSIYLLFSRQGLSQEMFAYGMVGLVLLGFTTSAVSILYLKKLSPLKDSVGRIRSS